jgi:hypothetical protein
VRKKKAKLTKYVFDKATFEEVGQKAAAGIVMNIKSGRQADGSPIKKNAPSTIRRKNKENWKHEGNIRSLIMKEERFIQPGMGSWRWFAYKDRVNLEPATRWLKDMSKRLQLRGYVGWLGLSKKTRRVVQLVFRKHILLLIKKNARRQG